MTSSYSETKGKKPADDHKGDGTVMEALSHLALFIFSHCICYYLWWSATFNHGQIGNPFPLQQEVIEKATPTLTSITIYGTLIVGHLIGAAVLPGPTVSGFSIPQENNRRLQYKCNALAAWYIAIALAAWLHCSGLFDLKTLYYESGALLTTATVFADVVALVMYLECLRTKRCAFSLRYFAHDFVMGQYLNPRIGNVDLKMWAEVRVSWLLLFSLDVSAALCLREKIGYIPFRMWIILLIHGLYTNACMKGEESIPYTWDIFQERWGWMLIYWNLAGVAFAYTFNGRFVAEVFGSAELQDDLHPAAFIALEIAVLAAYWVFDEANAQKNRFRAQQLSGAFVERPWALPQLPNATLHSPRYLTTKKGSTLLVDGWWQYVRKPHYAADLCLAVLLCLPCGFHHFLPYFFACFFLPMLVHREIRDTHRCSVKYGKDWDEYTALVPYILVPGIY